MIDYIEMFSSNIDTDRQTIVSLEYLDVSMKFIIFKIIINSGTLGI